MYFRPDRTWAQIRAEKMGTKVGTFTRRLQNTLMLDIRVLVPILWGIVKITALRLFLDLTDLPYKLIAPKEGEMPSDLAKAYCHWGASLERRLLNLIAEVQRQAQDAEGGMEPEETTAKLKCKQP